MFVIVLAFPPTTQLEKRMKSSNRRQCRVFSESLLFCCFSMRKHSPWNQPFSSTEMVLYSGTAIKRPFSCRTVGLSDYISVFLFKGQFSFSRRLFCNLHRQYVYALFLPAFSFIVRLHLGLSCPYLYPVSLSQERNIYGTFYVRRWLRSSKAPSSTLPKASVRMREMREGGRNNTDSGERELAIASADSGQGSRPSHRRPSPDSLLVE
jgi:hypothetical protein